MNTVPVSQKTEKETIYPSNHTKPLPAGEIAQETKNASTGTLSKVNSPDTQESDVARRMAAVREARRSAISKGTYARAIRAFCLECCGHNPKNRDCGGAELSLDGPCRLFVVNTVQKRRATLKSKIKRIIVEECRFCMQSRDISGCASPNCALYPFGPGKKKGDSRGKEI